MNLKIKSWEQLQSEGFKFSYPKCYRGTKKEPEGEFSYHWHNSILGKTAFIKRVKDYDRGILLCEVEKVSFHLPMWIFEDDISILKFKKPIEKKFEFSSKPILYVKGFGFEFPCSLDEMSEKQAREVAKWVLKVTE